jgi:uncharacterized protein YkwD
MIRRLQLPCAVLVLSGLCAAGAAYADAYAAVQVLRAGGCGGLVPAAQPLHRDPVLDQAARRWAGGATLNEATAGTAYRAQSADGVHVRAPQTQLLEVLRQEQCRALSDRNLADIGVYRRGEETWLIVASMRAMPTVSASAPPSLTNAAVTRYSSPASIAPGSRDAAYALQLVNDVRARGTRCGSRVFAPAPPMTLSGTLESVAYGHAADMAVHNYFEHEDLTGKSPADRVRAVGYREKLVGENIAYGPKTIAEVVQGWLDSPGHCENIMDPRFMEMGIARATGQLSRHGLYWVQVFAAPRA